MISIIVIAKNEEKTIASVIDACKNSLTGHDKEIIVSLAKDNKDRTIEISKNKKGIRVIVQESSGKGMQMETGLRHAKGDIIVYTDGDIKNLKPSQIDALARPILGKNYDFVKGSYTNKGRVSEFVVKPLLSFAFPEIANVRQPLSGQIAGKKQFFKKIKFEHGWGVEIGMLIDIAMAKAKIKEVLLPYKEDSFKAHLQGNYLDDIIKTLINRAKKHKRINLLKKQELRPLLYKFHKILKDEI